MAVAVLVAAGFTCHCLRDPGTNYLTGDGSAAWILFPAAPFSALRPAVELDTVFRRQFNLDQVPRAARLNVRGAKRVAIEINGRPVALPGSRDWKQVLTVDARPYLRRGTNSIQADVSNDSGPPCLWLALETDRVVLRSGDGWEASCAGSAWRRAALASAQRIAGPGNAMFEGETALNALRSVWPIWAAFAAVAILLCAAVRFWLRRAGSTPAGRLDAAAIVVLGAAIVLWVVLFWHNTALLPRVLGFDAGHHTDYILYLKQHRALPSPKEGFEMYQPPLYYAISATALSCFGLSGTEPAAGTVLRTLGACFGIAQFGLVFLCLRRLMPGKIGPQLAGMCLAAFVPMQLYLSHYTTNETMAATLVAATIYLCLRALQNQNAAVLQYVLLGLFMGAGCLTKATDLLLVPVVVTALIVGANKAKSAQQHRWRGVGIVLASWFVVCGWYYIRVWARFGTPLLGNWDTASGFHWWQDNGYRTATDYMRFGRSLGHPFFAGLSGFADGIYSTLWGDGLRGGSTDWVLEPPWNYTLMTAGYLLAMIPTLLLVLGAGIAAWRWAREPSTEKFAALGFLGAVGAALIYMSLKVPSYAEAKAFYGSGALLGICFCAAVGWETLTRNRKGVGFALGAALLVWAMNSFASVWVRPDATGTRVLHAFAAVTEGRNKDGLVELIAAVKSKPADARAALALGLALHGLGRPDAALPYAKKALELAPTDGRAHLLAGAALADLGQFEPAIAEGRKAAELGPESLLVYQNLSTWLASMGRIDDAINACREGLAEYPGNASLHRPLGWALLLKRDFASGASQFRYAVLLEPDNADGRLGLGLSLLRLGRAADALPQLRQAALLAPDSPEALLELSWVLATSPDAALRDGPQAMRLAEHARAVSGGDNNPRLLMTLAAAYAETGKFDSAISLLKKSMDQTKPGGDARLAAREQEMMKSFQSRRAYRHTEGQSGSAREAGSPQLR